MRRLQLVWQGGKVAFLAFFGWLAVHGTVLAQQPPNKADSGGGGGGGVYVASYAIVILGIALGLLLVCRPSRRRDRAKPEQYDEKGLLKEKE
jgi:hypothetical protein